MDICYVTSTPSLSLSLPLSPSLPSSLSLVLPFFSPSVVLPPISPFFYRSVLRVLYKPESLGTEVSLLEDTLRQAMEALDPNSIENFITVYGFLCDYYGTQYLEDVSSVSNYTNIIIIVT